MRVLYVTNMYPSKEDPNYGVFVKEQIEAIKQKCNLEETIYVIDGRKGIKEYIKSLYLRLRDLLRRANMT